MDKPRIDTYREGVATPHTDACASAGRAPRDQRNPVVAFVGIRLVFGNQGPFPVHAPAMAHFLASMRAQESSIREPRCRAPQKTQKTNMGGTLGAASLLGVSGGPAQGKFY